MSVITTPQCPAGSWVSPAASKYNRAGVREHVQRGGLVSVFPTRQRHFRSVVADVVILEAARAVAARTGRRSVLGVDIELVVVPDDQLISLVTEQIDRLMAGSRVAILRQKHDLASPAVE